MPGTKGWQPLIAQSDKTAEQAAVRTRRIGPSQRLSRFDNTTDTPQTLRLPATLSDCHCGAATHDVRVMVSSTRRSGISRQEDLAHCRGLRDPVTMSDSAAARSPSARAARAIHRRGDPHAPAATVDQIQRTLAEARTVTATEQDGQVELQLGHFCNNRCVFCASGQLTEQGHAAPVPARKLRAALEAVAAKGIRRVTFLGGEPTIQESFLPGLRAAAELGFTQVVIFTNGARLADPRFRDAVESVVSAHGIDLQWRISIQGADAVSHDRAVGKPGAFARIVRGLEALAAQGRAVTVNMCLTSGSVATLPALADLVLRYRVQQVCIDMVRPVSAGERTSAWMQDIMPRFASLAAPLRELTVRLRSADPLFDVNYTHVPMCVAADLAPYLHHGGEPTVTLTADLDERQGVMDKYAFQASDRRKLTGCRGCVFEWRCTGVAHEYLDGNGESEFVPHTPEVVRERGVQRAVMVDLFHAALQDWQPAGAWRAAHVDHDPRARRSEVQFVHRQFASQRWSLWLAADDAAVAPHRLTWLAWPDGRVELDPTSGVPAAADLAAIATELIGRLDGVGVGPLTAVASADDVQRLAQNRHWLQAALERVLPRMVGWHMHREGAIAVLTWQTDGQPRWLRLAAGAAHPVGWQARHPALEAADPHVTRLSQYLGAALRATRPPAANTATLEANRPL